MIFVRYYKLLFIIAFLLLPIQALAETRYVSDILVISVRDAPTRSASILGHLRSGKAIEVIEDNGDGYLLVTADSGIQGWVQKRYTTIDLPKAQVISQLKAHISSLKKKLRDEDDQQQKKSQLAVTRLAEIKQLRGENDDLLAKMANMQKITTEAQERYQDLQEKAKGVTEIYSERDELLGQNSDMKQKITFLEAENADLVQTGRILWFLAGFGVFFLGWLVGKMGKKQRHSSITL